MHRMHRGIAVLCPSAPDTRHNPRWTLNKADHRHFEQRRGKLHLQEAWGGIVGVTTSAQCSKDGIDTIFFEWSIAVSLTWTSSPFILGVGSISFQRVEIEIWSVILAFRHACPDLENFLLTFSAWRVLMIVVQSWYPHFLLLTVVVGPFCGFYTRTWRKVFVPDEFVVPEIWIQGRLLTNELGCGADVSHLDVEIKVCDLMNVTVVSETTGVIFFENWTWHGFRR